MNKRITIIMFVAAVVALSAGVWIAKKNATPQAQNLTKPQVIQGAIYPQAKKLKPFNLLDQQEQKITDKDFLNRWSLIFIGYTHCPDVCPTTLALLNQVDEVMKKQNMQAPKIVFLSVDPQRDTPAVLKPYVEYFNKNILALTGEAAEIKQLTQQLNAVYRKAKGASGNLEADDYLMDHSSALLLINPNGSLQSVLTAPHTPANVIDSILKSQAYFENQHH